MNKKASPERVWREYEKGVAYNNSLNLYEQVKKNENFYIGRQWEGLCAPDLAKPVINVLRRVVSYFISMIVSDDVGATLTPFDQYNEKGAKILERELEKILEQSDIKSLARSALRDSAVDGDGAIYFYFDPKGKNPDGSTGRVRGEVIAAYDVHYANPYLNDVQAQPYIIVSSRRQLGEVKHMAHTGVRERIRPDHDSNRYNIGKKEDDMVTVLTKFWREGELIYCSKSTRDVLLQPPICTGLSRYPVAVMPWESVKNSCRGVSALGAMIPNQIAINQLFAMAIHHVKSQAFPKIIFDATKIKAWSNKVGQAIGTQGNPNDAVAGSFKAQDMSDQVLTLIDKLTQSTLEFMGASDAALGNVRPDNTSAIIATQKASSMPLEIQRLNFYRFTEDCLRIICDIVTTSYGFRRVGDEYFDFSRMSESSVELKVDVGAATYWSELMQMQTLDNLFSQGIITDAVTYLEQVPDRYVRGKAKLIESLKEKITASPPDKV
ncbi:MAG: hypothetical protein IKU25_03295 [Clostridia bacterium]|nr:hypothetical protein [Clostridia bacterium]